MKLYFFRHLPTKNNLNNVFIGRLDLECDSEYISEHFASIRSRLNALSFDRVFCSPLKRARSSADLFFPHSYFVDRRLIERDLGVWSNVSKQDIKDRFPEAFFSNGNLDFSYTPMEGEAFIEVLRRVASFILDVVDNSREDDNIAIVTHNGIITSVKCLVNNSYSTEIIKYQPFMEEYVLEITDELIERLEEFISSK